MNGLAQARFGLFRPDSGYDRVALTFLGWMVSAFRARQDLVLENLALHQQLLALHAQRPDHRSTGKGGAGVAFAWMLQDNPGWDLERVNATMDGHKENFQVNLVTRIPVLIVYGTAAVNEENQIRFFDDI